MPDHSAFTQATPQHYNDGHTADASGYQGKMEYVRPYKYRTEPETPQYTPTHTSASDIIQKKRTRMQCEFQQQQQQ
eukprot:12230614-Prorocentrum_lima.AAC.1